MAKRSKRLMMQRAFEVLDSRKWWSRPVPWHWQTDLAGDQLDYWPTTGRWRWRERSYEGLPESLDSFIAEHEHDQPQEAEVLIEP